MYYLKDSSGTVVRAIEWSDESDLNFVLRHDSRRVEVCSRLEIYDELDIEYTILDTIVKRNLILNQSYPIKKLSGHLSLVKEAHSVLKNVELPSDDLKYFNMISKRTLYSATILAVILVASHFIIKPSHVKKEEIQVVQVMDRSQIVKMLTSPIVKPMVSKTNSHFTHSNSVIKPFTKLSVRKSMAQSSGVLGILGSLKKSSQKGGLKLDQAQATAGIGHGGQAGSGGVQTTIYAKGMFAAHLGRGGKINGSGGYGTKGKGGGQAGYGEVSLVGSGQSFFQPIESAALVEGGLDRNEIAAVIQRHLSEVRFCYEQGLQLKPKLAGRLSMNFLITANGTVSIAKIMNSSLGHPLVETCIRDHLKKWNFPKPEGGVTVKVTYPFILRRVSDT